MAAILGVVLSYATLVTGLSGPVAGASNVCAAGDVCQPTVAVDDDDAAALHGDGDWSSRYATPAEVDCRALRLTAGASSAATRNEVDLLSGACNQPMWNFGYRVSRFADAERPNGALGPQRGRQPVQSVAPFAPTWRTLPFERGRLDFVSGPPMAMYATVATVETAPLLTRLTTNQDDPAPSRVIEPPERPPRTLARPA